MLKLNVLAVLFLLLLPQILPAQSVYYDPTFGENGLLLRGFPNAYYWPYETLVDSTDRIYVVGALQTDNVRTPFVQRFLRDGTVDSTFAEDGLRLFPEPFRSGSAYSAFLQPDGKLVLLISQFLGSDGDISLIRMDGEARLDSSFHQDGVLTLNNLPGTQWGNKLVLLPDGKLLVSAVRNFGTEALFFRLRPDGEIDTSFGDEGFYLNKSDEGINFNSVVVNSAGEVFAAGRVFRGTNDFLIVKLTPDGDPDPNFGVDGTVLMDLNGVQNFIEDLALLNDGHLLIAGNTGVDTVSTGVLFSLRADNGAVNQSFAQNGFHYFPSPRTTSALLRIITRSDGTIVVAGNHFDPLLFTNDLFLSYFKQDGSPVADYGNGGEIALAIDGLKNYGGLAFDSDNNLLVTGFVDNPDTIAPFRLWIIKVINEPLTGVREVGRSDLQINVYPNPTSDVIRLQLEGELSGEVACVVYDSQGRSRLVYRQRITGPGEVLELPVTALESGLYYLTVQYAGGGRAMAAFFKSNY